MYIYICQECKTLRKTKERSIYKSDFQQLCFYLFYPQAQSHPHLIIKVPLLHCQLFFTERHSEWPVVTVEQLEVSVVTLIDEQSTRKGNVSRSMVHMKGQCQWMHGPHERVPFKVSLYKMPYFSNLLLHEHVRCPNFSSCLLFSVVFHFLPRFSEMKDK